MICPACGGNRTKAKCNLCELFAAQAPPQGHCPSGWPMVSSAAGVHPSQAKAAYDAAQHYGVPTDFTKEGDPVFTSARHRKDYCEKVRGFFDMNGGFADPTPQGVKYEGSPVQSPQKGD